MSSAVTSHFTVFLLLCHHNNSIPLCRQPSINLVQLRLQRICTAKYHPISEFVISFPRFACCSIYLLYVVPPPCMPVADDFVMTLPARLHELILVCAVILKIHFTHSTFQYFLNVFAKNEFLECYLSRPGLKPTDD